MSLNKQFFDSIQIELVKKKYYNANKVDALLSEIRSRALSLSEENAVLGAQLSQLNSQKAEISEAVMNAQLLSSEILSKANVRSGEAIERAEEQARELIRRAEEKAAALVARAEEQAEELLSRSRQQIGEAEALKAQLDQLRQRQQEYAVEKVEGVFTMLRQKQLDVVDALNLQWQEFLCGLYEDDGRGAVPGAGDAPEDLENKVSAIAEELNRFDEDSF